MASRPLAWLAAQLRWRAHWRCAEPVVVIESDDWGLDRRPSREFLRDLGRPTDWADESLESEAELDELYHLLERRRDADGRPVVVTANFIVANPDYERVVASGFREYHDLPIHTMAPTLVDKWREGAARKVLLPQYHGRSHFNVRRWLDELAEPHGPARAACTRGLHTPLALLEGQIWRYHSEYYDFAGGQSEPDELARRWLEGGLRMFTTTFGAAPASTIAPHYVFDAATIRRWADEGIRFIQGGNYHIAGRGPGGHAVILQHALGERSASGMTYVCRTLKFEPRLEKGQGDVDHAVGMARSCFEHRVPVVVDTHRINYVGARAGASRAKLDRFLDALAPWKPRYLTTAELGEAMTGHGNYADAWTGERRSLTPVRPMATLLTQASSWYHDRRIEQQAAR